MTKGNPATGHQELIAKLKHVLAAIEAQAAEGRYPPMLLSENGGDGVMPLFDAIHALECLPVSEIREPLEADIPFDVGDAYSVEADRQLLEAATILEHYDVDSANAAFRIFEDCRERGQDDREAFLKAIPRLIPVQRHPITTGNLTEQREIADKSSPSVEVTRGQAGSPAGSSRNGDERGQLSAIAPHPDSVRLDWIDQQGMNGIGHEGYGEFTHYSGDGFPPIREVVDEAMAKETK